MTLEKESIVPARAIFTTYTRACVCFFYSLPIRAKKNEREARAAFSLSLMYLRVYAAFEIEIPRGGEGGVS